MPTLTFTHKGSLTLDKLKSLYQQHHDFNLNKNIKNIVDKSHKTVMKFANGKNPIYGVNTGFGKLAHKKISEKEISKLQHHLIFSHAVGTGDLIPDEIVRIIYALKINSLVQGFSGIRYQLIEHIVALHNHEIYPCIPEKGSVGASGDLAPLAHFSLPLLGAGFCRFDDCIISGNEALQIAQIPVLNLQPKEGLSLINGTQVSTAFALSAYFEIDNIFNAACYASALSMIASGGHKNIFDDRIHQVRRQQGQITVAEFIRSLIAPANYQENKNRVQDPYSLRCIPQVLGACLDQINFAANVLEDEINSVTDNPLVFDNEIVSGGNFHAEPIAFAADQLALAIAEIASLSERRIAFLMDEHMSGLPAFLTENPGLNSGFMIAHVTAAALVSENKCLAHPSSVDSIPTSANQEDHVSMATYGARRLLTMADNAATVIAIELISACQAIDLAKPKKLSPQLERVYQLIREHIPYLKSDAFIASEIEEVKILVKNGF